MCPNGATHVHVANRPPRRSEYMASLLFTRLKRPLHRNRDLGSRLQGSGNRIVHFEKRYHTAYLEGCRPRHVSRVGHCNRVTALRRGTRLSRRRASLGRPWAMRTWPLQIITSLRTLRLCARKSLLRLCERNIPSTDYRIMFSHAKAPRRGD